MIVEDLYQRSHGVSPYFTSFSEYAYDHQGRMVSKEVSDATNNSQLETRNYLWDNWNIISETVIDHPSQATNRCYYVWGIDLSGTLQGAGGVGGLLAVINDDNIYAPTYDANGNVSEYVSLADGATVAHYEYDPFGNTVVQSGPLADTFTFRFSTKPYCPITGIVHYQKRPYSPPLGRFLPRDPIEEQGGINLYGFVGNDPANKWDVLGASTSPWPLPLGTKCDSDDDIGSVKYGLWSMSPSWSTMIKYGGNEHWGPWTVIETHIHFAQCKRTNFVCRKGCLPLVGQVYYYENTDETKEIELETRKVQKDLFNSPWEPSYLGELDLITGLFDFISLKKRGTAACEELNRMGIPEIRQR